MLNSKNHHPNVLTTSNVLPETTLDDKDPITAIRIREHQLEKHKNKKNKIRHYKINTYIPFRSESKN